MKQFWRPVQDCYSSITCASLMDEPQMIKAVKDFLKLGEFEVAEILDNICCSSRLETIISGNLPEIVAPTEHNLTWYDSHKVHGS
jgi:hypothetical protein